MKRSANPHSEPLLRWEDYANQPATDARLRMARSVIGQPHWGPAQRDDRPVFSARESAPAAVTRRVVAWLANTIQRISARRSAVERLVRMDPRLLRDIGLEAVDIDNLVMGHVSLQGLNARRRLPEVGQRVATNKAAEVVELGQGVNDPVHTSPLRQAA